MNKVILLGRSTKLVNTSEYDLSKVSLKTTLDIPAIVRRRHRKLRDCFSRSREELVDGMDVITLSDDWMSLETFYLDVRRLPRYVDWLNDPKRFQLVACVFNATHYSKDTASICTVAESQAYRLNKAYAITGNGIDTTVLKQEDIGKVCAVGRRNIRNLLRGRTVQGFTLNTLNGLYRYMNHSIVTPVAIA